MRKRGVQSCRDLNWTMDQNGTKYETVLVAAVQAFTTHRITFPFMAALDQERKNAVRADLTKRAE